MVPPPPCPRSSSARARATRASLRCCNRCCSATAAAAATAVEEADGPGASGEVGGGDGGGMAREGGFNFLRTDGPRTDGRIIERLPGFSRHSGGAEVKNKRLLQAQPALKGPRGE
uniref:Uncharacterized protein n=1 Tax=Prasinoderma singulare TaxID=676789 RepID=A0A7S3FD11_9VIRI